MKPNQHPTQSINAAPERPAPTWQCEFCGRFYSERTASAHGWCQQEQDRKDAEQAWPA